MYEEIITARKIIKRFRARDEWEPNHNEMMFGKTAIGYYDTISKKGYFILKFDGIELVCFDDCITYEIQFQGGRRFSTFKLGEWLMQLDKITAPKPVNVTIDGVEYWPCNKN